jgi:hypothetical protein
MSTREKGQTTCNGQQASGERSNKILSYKDLLVWQKSMRLVETVYRLSVQLPASEQWGLISQMRRAAVSIPSNIAEGYGRQPPSFHRPWFVAGVRNSGSFMSKTRLSRDKPCRSLAERN